MWILYGLEKDKLFHQVFNSFQDAYDYMNRTEAYNKQSLKKHSNNHYSLETDKLKVNLVGLDK